jgi:hypothetical protein
LLESRQLLSVGATPSTLSGISAQLNLQVQLLASSGVSGYTPQQIQTAYAVSGITFSGGSVVGNGAGQTIAIVDAYNDPNIAAGLASFDSRFGLKAPASFNVTASLPSAAASNAFGQSLAQQSPPEVGRADQDYQPTWFVDEFARVQSTPLPRTTSASNRPHRRVNSTKTRSRTATKIKNKTPIRHHLRRPLRARYGSRPEQSCSTRCWDHRSLHQGSLPIRSRRSDCRTNNGSANQVRHPQSQADRTAQHF